MARSIVGCVSLGLLIGSVAALSGCECESAAAAQAAKMLSAASFDRRIAETPEEMEKLQSLPQRTLFRLEDEDNVYSAYADAKYCGCIYVGDEDAAKRYERMVIANRIAMQRVLREDFSGMRLRVWGPWDPL